MPMQITRIVDTPTLEWVSAVFARAAEEGLQVRMSQSNEGMKFSVGSSMWTLPLGTDITDRLFN